MILCPCCRLPEGLPGRVQPGGSDQWSCLQDLCERVSREVLTRTLDTGVMLEWVIVMQPCAGNKVIYILDNII